MLRVHADSARALQPIAIVVPIHRDRIRVGGLPIDSLTLEQAVGAVEELVSSRGGGTVFTPNVDHIVQSTENPRLRRAYELASLSLVDGMPVVWASRLLGTPLPERICGADLVTRLLSLSAERRWRVFFLGAGEGVAEQAEVNATRTVPGLNIVGTLSPRIDLQAAPSDREWIVDKVRATAPDLVLVAFGAPKQELFIAEVHEALRPAVLLGIGATLDFLAGVVPRAPAWMARNGFEWAYRLAQEPRRLWRRYLVRDPKFALILLQSLWERQAT